MPRQLVRQIKWELVLLLLVLLLCMTPTAGLFRWSFRWLPFFHLVLAICAAEALRLKPGSPTPATAALGLVVLIGVAALIFHTTGSYAFPLTWIFIGLAAVWVCLEFLPTQFRFSIVDARRDHVLRLPRHISLRSDERWSAALQFSQELLKPAPLDPQRLYLSVYPWAELTYCIANKPQTGRPNATAGKHLDVGRIAIHQWLQPDPRRRCGTRICKPAFMVKLIPT